MFLWFFSTCSPFCSGVATFILIKLEFLFVKIYKTIDGNWPCLLCRMQKGSIWDLENRCLLVPRHFWFQAPCIWCHHFTNNWKHFILSCKDHLMAGHWDKLRILFLDNVLGYSIVKQVVIDNSSLYICPCCYFIPIWIPIPC